MQKVKRRIEHFSYYDMEGIAEHLRKMAAKGWRLQRITPLYWEYEADTPKRVHYFLTFGTKGVFGYQESDWTYVTNWQDMEFYYTEDTSVVVPIQDSQKKLHAMQKQMQQSFLPIYKLGIFLALALLCLPCFAIAQDFLTWLPDDIWMLSAISGILLFLYAYGRLRQYHKWCKHSKECMYQYGLCAHVMPGQRRKERLIFFTTLLVLLLYSLVLIIRIVPDLHIEPSYFSIFAGVLLLLFCGWRIWDKRNQPVRTQTPWKKSYLRTSVMLLCLPVLLSGVMYVGGKGEFFPKHAVAVIPVKESTGLVYDFKQYQDTLPLSVEDLLGIQEGVYSKSYQRKASVLAAYARGSQTTPPDGSGLPELEYEVWQWRGKTQFTKALDSMLSAMIEDDGDLYEDSGQAYRPISLEGTDVAYQRYYKIEPCNEFLFTKGNQIVHVLTSWEMTQEQLDTVVSKLLLSEEAKEAEEAEDAGTVLHSNE